MTEPNVLGNISPAKFLFDSGNTEIINLWKINRSSGGADDYTSFIDKSGSAYKPAAGKAFYLLFFQADWVNSGDIEIDLESNSTADTNVGGTKQTEFTFYADDTGAGTKSDNIRHLCIKFAAGEYITPVLTSGNDWFGTAWGVECDA